MREGDVQLEVGGHAATGSLLFTASNKPQLPILTLQISLFLSLGSLVSHFKSLNVLHAILGQVQAVFTSGRLVISYFPCATA